MLILSKMVIERPIMSLRTGRQVGTAHAAIINPNNLKIEGFYCTDSMDKKKQLVLVTQDIRDVLPVGIVVDDHDAMTEPEDLIRLNKIMKMQFELIGMPVVTENRKRLGKVNDYSLEPNSMIIKKLYVTQTLIKNITGGSLSVDRNQIVEINNRKIIIKDPLQGIKAGVPAMDPVPLA